MNYTENVGLSTCVDQLIDLLDALDETLNPKFYDESGIQREGAPEQTKGKQFLKHFGEFMHNVNEFFFHEDKTDYTSGSDSNGQWVTIPSVLRAWVPSDSQNPEGPPGYRYTFFDQQGQWRTIPSGQKVWVPDDQEIPDDPINYPSSDSNGQWVTLPSVQKAWVPSDSQNPKGPPAYRYVFFPLQGQWRTLPSGQQVWVPDDQEIPEPINPPSSASKGKWVTLPSGQKAWVPSDSQNPQGSPEYVNFPSGGQWITLPSGQQGWVPDDQKIQEPINPPSSASKGKWVTLPSGQKAWVPSDSQNPQGSPEYVNFPSGGQWITLPSGQQGWVPDDRKIQEPINPPYSASKGQWVNLPRKAWVPDDIKNAQGPKEYVSFPSGGQWITLPSGQQGWVPDDQQPQGPEGSTDATAGSTAHGGDASATSTATSEHGGDTNATSTATSKGGNANATSTATSKGGNANATSEAVSTAKRYGAPMTTRSQMPKEVVQSSGYPYDSDSSYVENSINSHPAIIKSYQDIYKTLQNIKDCINNNL